MITALLTLCTALLGALPAIIRAIEHQRAAEATKAKGLAHVELQDTDAAMAKVDAVYDAVRSEQLRPPAGDQ